MTFSHYGVYHNDGCDCERCEFEHRRVTGHATFCAAINDGARQCDCGAAEQLAGTVNSDSPDSKKEEKDQN